MNDDYVEKESFKKYYAIYTATIISLSLTIFLVNLFIFQFNTSLGSIITLLTAMMATSVYAQDVERKLTKTEKRKLIIGTSTIGFIILLIIAPFTFDITSFKPFNLFLGTVIIALLHILLHWMGCSAGNQYHKPNKS